MGWNCAWIVVALGARRVAGGQAVRRVDGLSGELANRYRRWWCRETGIEPARWGTPASTVLKKCNQRPATSDEIQHVRSELH
jgi:hypothetical protein